MKFKAKVRKIGNSFGVIIPRDVITAFTLGEEIELNVITKDVITQDVITEKESNVITHTKDCPNAYCSGKCYNDVNHVLPPESPSQVIVVPSNPPGKPKKQFNCEMCKKHGVFKGSCNCE